jgi:hypothetical protein
LKDLIKRLPVLIVLLTLCLVTTKQAVAQFITIRGTVYDISARRPIEAVAVLSNSGRSAYTDSAGRYLITVLQHDSIWFSLIGKSTRKYAVDTIANTDNFNVMIHIYVSELPEVKVRNSYYKYDSLMNRRDYAKIFNYKKPGISLSKDPGYNPGGLTVGFDLDAIINMFRTKYNRSILTLQQRLIEQEHEKYVNHRFSKQFVRKITQLQSPELDSFMKRYRPEYDVVTTLNDLELGYYIQQCFEQYKTTLRRNRRGFLWRREE